jgi:hypothetical protein
MGKVLRGQLETESIRSMSRDVALPESPKAYFLRRFAIWAMIGGAIGLVALLIAWRVKYHDPTPRLTPELFEAGHKRWEAAAPASYDIEVRVTGSQPAVYRVEVRNHEPTSAWRNGQPLLTRRTFGTWSVPGMFSTIGRDIESIERHATGKADRFTPRLLLRCQFDPKYSYPERYRRIEQWSTVDVAWEVTEFKVVGSQPSVVNER